MSPCSIKAAHFPTRSVASWGCLDCCRCIPQQSMNSLRDLRSSHGSTEREVCQMKLLIAYDGSKCADSALDDLTHAGLPDVGEALVMSVAEVWLPPPPPSSYEILEMASAANTPFGLERRYMAGSQ